MAEINMIQKLAFKISYDKYKFCPAFETTDEQLITYLEKASVYKIITGEKIVGSIFIYEIGDHHYELDTISILHCDKAINLFKNKCSQLGCILIYCFSRNISLKDLQKLSRV